MKTTDRFTAPIITALVLEHLSAARGPTGQFGAWHHHGSAAILEGAPHVTCGFGELTLKDAHIAAWSDVTGREAALAERCAAGDDAAYVEIVADHQRMVVQLGVNLLGDRDEALDLAQDVFLRVFR